MKTLIIVFLTLLAACIGSANTKVPTMELYKAIMEVSDKYNVDSLLILKVIMAESKGNPMAYNKHSDDHGLMQIHGATARSMGVSKTCLYTWKCNLDTGVRIMSKMKRICRYNVGNGVLKGDKLRKCLQYERKLDNL